MHFEIEEVRVKPEYFNRNLSHCFLKILLSEKVMLLIVEDKTFSIVDVYFKHF
jgi:hypothetical protein